MEKIFFIIAIFWFNRIPAQDVGQPIKKSKAYINVKDFGAKGNGIANDALAIQAAINIGGKIFFPNGMYKIDSTITISKKAYLFGDVKTTIKMDGTVFNIQHDSVVITIFNFINIKTPYLIKRDSSNWAIYPAFLHSNGIGYMPTVNDAMYDSLPSNYKNQSVGCTIYSGSFKAIELSYLTGNFLQIFLQGTAYSKVFNCNYRAGSYGVALWNNNSQKGESNEVFKNTIRYASYCGVALINNNNSKVYNNNIYNCGESGIKTWQNTILGNNARCTNTSIYNNNIAFCIYDGIDAAVNYPYDTLNLNNVRVYSNYIKNCGGNGINIDGMGPTVQKNRIEFCRQSGIFSRSKNSLISGNNLFNNNAGNFSSGVHEITEDGGLDNVIMDNVVKRTDNKREGYGIYVGRQTKRTVVKNNSTKNASVQDMGLLTIKSGNK